MATHKAIAQLNKIKTLEALSEAHELNTQFNLANLTCSSASPHIQELIFNELLFNIAEHWKQRLEKLRSLGLNIKQRDNSIIALLMYISFASAALYYIDTASWKEDVLNFLKHEFGPDNLLSVQYCLC